MAQPQSQYPDPEMNEMLDRPWIGPQDSFQDESVNEYFGDADSDLREFEASIANIEEEVLRLEGYDPTGSQDFSALMRSRSYSSISRARARQRIGQQRRHGLHRGPRKAAEPTGDIKLRLGHATEAFIAARYVDAALIIADIIRINAETHEAWSLLHSVFRENNDVDNALKALIYAAHLRPKHTSSWYQCAQFALEGTGSLRSKYLLNAEFCYAAAIRADPANLDARYRKAAVCIERGKIGPAISDYKVILSRQPHDRDILRRLAELYIDQDEASTAIDLYRESITHFKSSSGQPSQVFDWTDLDTYVTLYEHDARYDIAIQQLRSLARWLSGRGAEEFWDEFPDDDREWDSDDKRRTLVPSFNPEKYSVASYGGGLPLEFRIKLGIYRLHLGNRDEAFHHFGWLVEPGGTGEDAASRHPYLFRLVADHLFETNSYKDALSFYQKLRHLTEETDGTLLVQMGKCFLKAQDDQKAEECFQSAVELDVEDIDPRIELAHMYERMGKPEKAFNSLNEAMLLRRRQDHRNSRRPFEELENRKTEEASIVIKKPTRRRYRPRQQTQKRLTQVSEAEHLQSQYFVLRKTCEAMRSGDAASTEAWMDAARDLTDDFRGFKKFYPLDKYIRFLGYSGDSRIAAETPLDMDLTAMAERLSRGLTTSDQTATPAAEIPDDYRGIPFSTWLDIFLEYALCLAKNGEKDEAYSLCEATKDAIVFYHSREDMFLVHVCWCVCALLANDEETCVSVARFFMKDYQFTTDSYRMFAAVTKVCHSPISWYSSGPTQKYVLRQIKAMDYSLVNDSQRKRYFSERGSYSARDESGHPIINDDLDIALLMLYGHILFSSTGYLYALNYFLRAHALDPENPMINLSTGLAYVHLALKRQTDNRQQNILQGTTFLFRYYNSRRNSVHTEERQEAHFNMARTYHMLGLTHLAIPYYEKVFSESSRGTSGLEQEDLIIDTAYNLQTLYATAGNLELAENITMEWLVI